MPDKIAMPVWPNALSRATDAIFSMRERLVGDLRFQRTVARIPFVRKIAQKQARDVFDLCTGFVYSQVLLACVQLDILQLCRCKPQSLSEIARAARLSDDATSRLVSAAVSLGLLQARSGERYGLGLRGAAIVANPGLLKMIEHHGLFYKDMADPVALLRGEAGETGLSRYWAYAQGRGNDLQDDDVAPYTDLMAQSQTFVAEDVLDAYDFGKHTLMLDVGGGDGTFIVRTARRNPKLRFQHFDLPPVSARAAAHFTRAGLNQRAISAPGSFVYDELPQGADLVTLVRVLHDHDDQTVKTILRRARHAIAPGGTLLIAEPMAGTRGAESMGDAYFGFYLLAMGRGRPRTREDLSQLVVDAGFRNPTEVPTSLPLQTRLLKAIS